MRDSSKQTNIQTIGILGDSETFSENFGPRNLINLLGIGDFLKRKENHNLNPVTFEIWQHRNFSLSVLEWIFGPAS